MPIKYTCPKCGRRFTQWGAEKAGFKCPTDQWATKDHPAEVELVRLGPSEDRPSRRPALKKGARKLAVSLPAGYGDEGIMPDVDELDGAAEFPPSGENFDEAESEDDEAFDEEAAPDVIGEAVVGDEVVAVEEELGEVIDIGDSNAEEELEGAEEPIEEEWSE